MSQYQFRMLFEYPHLGQNVVSESPPTFNAATELDEGPILGLDPEAFPYGSTSDTDMDDEWARKSPGIHTLCASSLNYPKMILNGPGIYPATKTFDPYAIVSKYLPYIQGFRHILTGHVSSISVPGILRMPVTILLSPLCSPLSLWQHAMLHFLMAVHMRPSSVG
ncbi:Ff.00g050200.m01.CDS01 [Fusarium sp. VM40]|nr:Ff.00g050200.m01.CDS01 [Fusarium sp. VM40]